MSDGNRPSLLARIERRLPELYLVLALVLTSLVALITAPFYMPDEPNQACRAISLGHGRLIAQMGPHEAGAQVDQGALAAMEGVEIVRVKWEHASPDFHDRHYGAMPLVRLPAASQRWANATVFVPFGNTAVYPPMLYAPAVAGWRLGEAFNLTIFHSLLLARLFSAWTAVAIGWLALRLCACSRFMLVPLLLLPHTLFLNAGCSQDAVMLSVAALAAALLSRPLVGRREFTPAELAITAAALAMCGTARPPYVAMALLLFVPTVELHLPDPRRWLRPLAAFAATLAICALWRYLVAPLGLDWADNADPETQYVFMHDHPFATAAAVLHGTFDGLVDFFHRGLYVIGGNDLLPHHGAAFALTILLALMLLFAPACPPRRPLARALLAVCIAGPLLGVSLAEYVIWTPPGLFTVYGVQPRYWLPLLPLVTMLLQGQIPVRRIPERVRQNLLLTTTAALVLIACSLPWFAAHAFYRSGAVQVLSLNLH